MAHSSTRPAPIIRSKRTTHHGIIAQSGWTEYQQNTNWIVAEYFDASKYSAKHLVTRYGMPYWCADENEVPHVVGKRVACRRAALAAEA